MNLSRQLRSVLDSHGGQPRQAALFDFGRPRLHLAHSRDEGLRDRSLSDSFDLLGARFCFDAQPIVDFSTHQVTQYELLLRSKSSQSHAPVKPAQLLAHAERAGVVHLIDAWVVREAVRLLSMAPFRGRTIFHVNVSGASAGSPAFASFVDDTIGECHIDPSQLVVELTETAAIVDLEQARRFASALRERGCRVALDDFGAGFGSFQYLKHLPFDILKIDGDFVKDLRAGSVDRTLVRAIVGIAHALGKTTIAECIESAAVAASLEQEGVDAGQGFHLGEPRPVRTLMLENLAAMEAAEAPGDVPAPIYRTA